MDQVRFTLYLIQRVHQASGTVLERGGVLSNASAEVRGHAYQYTSYTHLFPDRQVLFIVILQKELVASLACVLGIHDWLLKVVRFLFQGACQSPVNQRHTRMHSEIACAC